MEEPREVVLLPIDIHYNKLLDWLINRRHCKHDWQASILEVREKISAAIQDMPAVDEITELIKGSHINYFHCRRIVELLKDTESGTKNIFGRYSSQRMKDWLEIVGLYEKNDLYLAEAAQLLARSVNYEVPLFKKQIAKCQQVQKDCNRKESDSARSAAEYREKYTTTCKQMCIEGKKIRSELARLVEDLPNVYGAITADSQSLTKAVNYYVAFVQFNNDGNIKVADVLPTLRHIMQRGNTTVYEFERGTAPSRVDEDPIRIDLGDEEQNKVNEADEIDWGDLNDGIDLDLDYDLGNITIEDGGIEMEGSGDAAFTSSNENPDETTETQTSSPSSDPVNGQKKEDCVARGRQAMTILDNTDTRNLFLDDLIEIEAFLCQRQVELHGAGDDVLSSCQFQSAPEVILVDENEIASMLTVVQTLLAQLTSVRMQHLMLIRNAPRYVERLEEKLKQMLTVSEKMLFYQKQAVERREASMDEERALAPQLDIAIRQTLTLRSQIEEEISKRYKNRRVNIMGEINSL